MGYVRWLSDVYQYFWVSYVNKLRDDIFQANCYWWMNVVVNLYGICVWESWDL